MLPVDLNLNLLRTLDMLLEQRSVTRTARSLRGRPVGGVQATSGTSRPVWGRASGAIRA